MKIQILSNEYKKTPAHENYCEIHPTGGSLTSALKMEEIFRQRGHEVEFLTDHETVGDGTCDVFVALRLWRTFFLGKHPGRVNYLWCKDDFDQPFLDPLRDSETAKNVYQHVTSAIFVSHFQAQRWIQNLNLPHEKCYVDTNGLSTELFDVNPENLLQRPRRAYYASTPFRGLDLLLTAWPWIRNAVPEAELLIYSSIQVYGPEEKPEHTRLYEKALSMESMGVRYCGSVGQKELRESASGCRVLAYPCIFPETSCIAAMEAMASGCAVVSTLLGALPETAWRNPLVPLGENWLHDWAFRVARILVDDSYYLALARQNLALTKCMDWNFVADRWLRKFEEDLKG